ncbi:MAG: DUF2867 domain-containing protein [Actinomycetota bacterium]
MRNPSRRAIPMDADLVGRMRFGHATTGRGTRPVPIPEGATLLHDEVGSTGVEAGDLVDAFAVRVPAGATTDPLHWQSAVFASPPPLVRGLLHLRQALVGLVGIDRADPDTFDPLEANDREVLVGSDERHLTFRASLLVSEDEVVLSTWARPANTRGRAYLWVVRLFHPWVVRAMLRRAATTLTGPAR